MARDGVFITDWRDDSTACALWGRDRLTNLPGRWGGIGFKFEIVLYPCSVLREGDSGFLIAILVDVYIESKAEAGAVWSKIETILAQGVVQSRVFQMGGGSVIKADREFDEMAGMHVFSMDVVLMEEDQNVALEALREYACFVYDEMNRLGWIQPLPLEGGAR